MTQQYYSDLIWTNMVCPSCRGSLLRQPTGCTCNSCGTRYEYSEWGSIDFRLKKPRKAELAFEIGSNIPAIDLAFEPLRRNPNPEVDFSKTSAPYHLTADILSYFPKARQSSSLMLDLGCGGAIHKGVCEYAGYEYVGMDYDSPGAPLLGDAHALPFGENVFEFILSIAVLEHIRYPFVMMAEAYRVLKPGGMLIGTVAFMEPFHLNSYYHHSHLGTLNSLQFAGFTVDQVAPSETWTVLRAQAVMSLFQRMPRRLSGVLIYPLHLMHRFWWRARVFKSGGTRVKMNDLIRNSTGAFTFIARKEFEQKAVEL